MFKSIYQGERNLFKQSDLEVSSSYFHDGESPLKEGTNITVLDSTFSYKTLCGMEKISISITLISYWMHVLAFGMDLIIILAMSILVRTRILGD